MNYCSEASSNPLVYPTNWKIVNESCTCPSEQITTNIGGEVDASLPYTFNSLSTPSELDCSIECGTFSTEEDWQNCFAECIASTGPCDPPLIPESVTFGSQCLGPTACLV